ncbi:MAG: CHASE3 domain-containing protein, partial [Nitrospirae bacterium]|nr:CHASE3 domain-containing protein [Nitrospirota bacterium]
MHNHFIKSCQQKFYQLQTRQKILLGFSVPLLLMVIIATVVYFSIGTMVDDAQWVQHTQQVIVGGQELNKLMIDMETGERGFLITGKEPFLEPFHAAQQVW